MAEFAQLVLAVDAQGVKSGTAALDRLETQARQTERATESMNAAGRAVGPSFSIAGGGARMLTQQLSQVGQQTMATGNFMQALAIQLPDIGLAFGAVGTAAGLLAGIGLPILGSALFGAGEDAKSFSDSMDEVESSLRQLDEVAFRATSDGLAELEARYGSLTAEVRGLIDALNDKALMENAQALQDAFSAITDELGAGFGSATGDIQELFNQTARQANVTLNAIEAIGDAETFDEMADQAAAFRQQLEVAQGGIANMSDEALSLWNRFVDIEDAARASARATGEVSEAVHQSALEAAGLNAQASLMSANFGNAAGAAWGIVSALSAAVSEAITLSNAQSAFRAENLAAGVTEDERGNTGNIANAIHNDLRAAAVERYGSALTGVGRAAGGAAQATEELASITETLDDILQGAADPVQEWRDGLQSIADNGIGGVADAIRDFGQSGFEDFSGFMDGMVDAAATAIEDITAQFASRSLASALGSFAGPVGGLLGGLVGGLFGGLFGGGGSTPYEETEQYDIDQEKAALIRQMHELEGHSNYLKRQEIKDLDQSNRALGRRIQQLEDEAEAAAEAARIADERMSLQMQLWELEGNTEAIRAAQLEQLDESNRALQEQIWAQQDLAAATAETTRAIEEAVAAISPGDYSTRFEYDRAIALAKNGYIPTTAGTPTTAASVAAEQSAQTANLSRQMSTLTTYMKQMLDLQFEWDRNGLLTVTS